MPATEKEKVFHSHTVTLNEAEMWGTDVHANGFVDEKRRLEIKLIIYFLSIWHEILQFYIKTTTKEYLAQSFSNS